LISLQIPLALGEGVGDSVIDAEGDDVDVTDKEGDVDDDADKEGVLLGDDEGLGKLNARRI
jgi:hypothetical protein